MRAMGEASITVADLNTGEVLSIHLIEPHNTYWRNQNKDPRPRAKLKRDP